MSGQGARRVAWAPAEGSPGPLTPVHPQGNQLRKMLLQNYLQNRKSSSRGDLPDPMGTGQCRLPCPRFQGLFSQAWALPPLRHPSSPPSSATPHLQAWTKTGQ